MRRCIKFWQDPNSANQGVIDDLPDRLRGIDLPWRVATILDEIGPCSTDIRETLGIGDMPVECIQFGRGHTVDRPQNRLFVDIVSASVQKDSTVRILWTICDIYIASYMNFRVQFVIGNQLVEGLQCVSSSEICIRRDKGFHLEIILINFNKLRMY